jgi:hypothetical protein
MERFEAERDKVLSAVAAEPRVVSHPLPVRSRSRWVRPRRVLAAPRAPPLRLPPAHRSHRSPRTTKERRSSRCRVFQARGQSHRRSHRASSGQGPIASRASRILSPAASRHATDTGSQLPAPNRVSLPHKLTARAAPSSKSARSSGIAGACSAASRVFATARPLAADAAEGDRRQQQSEGSIRQPAVAPVVEVHEPEAEAEREQGSEHDEQHGEVAEQLELPSLQPP